MDDDFDEKWFVKRCKDTLKQFKHVPEFTIQLLCKILRMLITALTCFDDAKLVDKQLWRFNVGTSELAWDFQRGPIPQQVHGLFARVHFLPSHYLQTFKEMIQYGFVEGWQASYFWSHCKTAGKVYCPPSRECGDASDKTTFSRSRAPKDI